MVRATSAKRMCSGRRALQLLAATLAVGFLIYFYFNRRGLRWYSESRWPYNADRRVLRRVCNHTKAELEQLTNLAHGAYRAFETLGVTSFLSHGSLFGALRYRGPIPWDSDIDMCVIGKMIDRYTLSELQAVFRKENLHIMFQEFGGQYKVVPLVRKGNFAAADVFPYYDSYFGDWMCRHGTESRWLFINFWYHHTIPKRLVREPLPKIEFGGMMMNTTRGRYKAQTYFYRDDWQREVRPWGCENTDVGPTQIPNIVTYSPEDPDDYV